MSIPQNPTVWVVTEGLKGTENQCLGIAEALGVVPVVKQVKLRQPWKALSPYLGLECALTFKDPLLASGETWPDILIASGRKSIAASRYIKKRSKGKTFTVQVQDPRIDPRQFDMVAVPEHDPTRGPNVVVTVATPNRITSQQLVAAHQEFNPVFSNFSYPCIAVLIGGSTKRHEFTQEEAKALADQLSPLKNLMVTTSRRTGEENTKLLKSALAKNGNYFWDGVSSNPYMGMLAYADFILVTADSTSMISEAATTGRRVYVLPMKGLTPRQDQLVQNLKTYGAVRDFEGKFEKWTYPPLADAQAVAAQIRQKCGLFS